MSSGVLVAAVFLLALVAIILLYVAAVAIGYCVEWHRRGISWDSFVAQARSGTGCIIVDHSIGRGHGLGSVVVWWSPERIEDPKLVPRYVNTRCKFTACPRRLRSIHALAKEFPNVQVVENFKVVDMI